MIRIYPIDFHGQGAMLTPADPELHDKAVKFCEEQLAKPVNLSELAKCWLAVDENTKKAVGIVGYVLKPDIPVMRATDATALSLMAERLQDYFADNGCRGKEVFVYLSKAEKPEERCPGWKQVLIKEQKAISADRFSITVR